MKRLVLRTANGSSVESTKCVGLAAFKPQTDFCRRVLVLATLSAGLAFHAL